MKFMSVWSVQPGKKAEAIAKFLATGAPAPQGVQILGRWHKADFTGGFTLAESVDAKALYESAAEWSDLVEIHIVPVVEDGEAGAVLAKLFKK